MKKLTKLFTVLFVIIAMFACVSTVLADEGEEVKEVEYSELTPFDEEESKQQVVVDPADPTVKQESVEAGKTEEQVEEPDELNVPVDFIEQDVPQEEAIPEEFPTAVITDTEGVAHVEEELVGENEESIVDVDYDFEWLHFSKTVTVEENQADILVTIHPELGKEVTSVEATAFDIGSWFARTEVATAVDVKQVIDDEGKGTGEWLVVTNGVEYKLHYDNILGKYYYNRFESGVEGDYDIIYIEIECDTIDLEAEGIQKRKGDLKLKEDDIVISEGLENITIFDAGNPENFVKNYERAYKDSNEGLTIDNIKYYVECLDEDGSAEGIKVSIGEDNKVQVTGIKEGKYVVYLEGYFTEELYKQKGDSNQPADFWERGKKGTSYYAEGDVKVVYKTTGPRFNKTTTKNVYELTTMNDGWATFAKFKVDVIGGVSSVDGNPDDRYNEWVVAEETKGNRGEKRYYTKKEGYDGVEFYDIDAYSQKTNRDGEVLPAEQISETKAPVTIELKVEDCEKVSGYTPKFTVFHYVEVANERGRGTHTELEEITDTKTIYKDGAYYVVFKASEFSKYSVAWNYKKNPAKTSYEFVNTGVDGTQQQVNVAGLVTMCAFALLVALKKKVSHC